MNLINKNTKLHLLSLFILNVPFVLLILTSKNGFFSYLYCYVICIAICSYIFDEKKSLFSVLYVLSCFFVLLLYLTQKYNFPGYYGFSPGSLAGTDDSYFYSLITDSLPKDFPVREYYQSRTHPYTTLVDGVIPFNVNHPTVVLFFNAISYPILALAVKNLTFEITKNKEIANTSLVLAFLCPFTIKNSLVFVRDGWVSAGYVCAILGVHQKRYIIVLLSWILVSYLRLSSGILLVFSSTLYFVLTPKRGRKGILFFASIWTLLSTAFFYLYGKLGFLSEYTSLVFSFFRSGFLSFIEKVDPGSFLLYAYEQPFPVRLFLGFAIFLTFPLFSPGGYTVNGSLVVRNLLGNTYSLLFIFYSIFLVKGILYSLVNKSNMLPLSLTFLFIVIVVSQLSLQIRHKTMFVPLSYVFISQGIKSKYILGKNIGIIFSLSLCLVTILKILFNYAI